MGDVSGATSYPATRPASGWSAPWARWTRWGCAAVDASGSWAYAYDGFGRPASTSWTSQGVTYTTSYTWNVDDTLASITYPTGRVVAYGRNAIGRITSITAGAQTIVSARSYRADGLLTGQTHGNGLADDRTYDLQGRLTSWTTGSIDSRTYGYDANGNITSINTSAYGYDALDRITSEPAQTFTYDANGNITRAGFNLYTYKANSNRQISSPNGLLATNAAGNITSLSFLLNFTYNQEGRMSKANNGLFTSVINVYAFDGHRARKTVGSAATLFHYDLDGHLIAETNAAGAALREFVRDDQGRPVAQFDSAGLSFLHFDHLGSPRFATNAAQAIVWSWKEKPYGTGAVTGSVTVPLRYPGQYFDTETGITQNWHRDYHAPSGRYLESDPIGLAGGINTYGYVGGNPLSLIDPEGLLGRGSGARGGRSTQVIWNGLGNTEICSYYDAMASKNPNCSYYKDAANICRGRGLRGWLTSSVVRAGITDAANRAGGRVYESTILDSIRSALIEADKRNRLNGNTDSNGCVCGNAIDAYHNRAFSGAGVDPSYYGGNNWPQSIPPNPVPLDPSASPYDPRRLWQ